MIIGKTVTVYDWSDIQKEICDIMDIADDDFRDYHNVVGGDYKDLWHVAMDTVIPNEMQNGTIVTMFPYSDDGELQEIINNNKEWTEPFFRAYQKVMNELDPNCNGVLVEFNW